MKDGFIKVSAVTPKLQLANVEQNVKEIIKNVNDLSKDKVKLIVFPELCLTGYTCQDLFFNETLLNCALNGLKTICEETSKIDALIFIGMPLKVNGRLFDVAVAIFKGKILGIIPKNNLADYNELCESRWFSTYNGENIEIDLLDEKTFFGNKLIFTHDKIIDFTIGVEISKEMFETISPSEYHAKNGANIIVNLGSFNEIVCSNELREKNIENLSRKCTVAYISANAGIGESTTDTVFAGGNFIYEKGNLLKKSKPFDEFIATTEIDVKSIAFEKSKKIKNLEDTSYSKISFNSEVEETILTRSYKKMPFVPSDKETLKNRCELVLRLQAEGLKRRIEHTKSKCAVIGLSGGLDSTLALLVAVKAMELLGRPSSDVLGITMPCFGTTGRTYNNTVNLAKCLKINLKTVNIEKAVTRHLKDIKHPLDLYDVTYENAQARERTQVLMDMANMYGGLVVGTGDLSELALGWATYNGDHMSMYGVNGGVPKTLIRYVISYYAKNSKPKLRGVLNDILDTPVSPELLPSVDGKISQKTEEIVGPYLLHDFYLYYIIKKGFSPKKAFRVAVNTFNNEIDPSVLKKWLVNFVRRYFTQQFKRSCLPDGVKVGSLSVSPRGDLKMPSDVFNTIWLNEAENIKI